MLQKHYHLLSKMIMNNVFDADWKKAVEESVNGYTVGSQIYASKIFCE